MAFKIEIDFGSGYIDITNDCSNLSRIRVAHKDLRLAVNTAKFDITDMTVANNIMTSTGSLPVRIQESSVDWFIGKVRSNQALTMTSGLETLGIECVDNSMDLQKVIDESFAWEDYKVCDTTTTSKSIVHQLIVKAGVSLANMNLTSINVTNPWYVVERQEGKTFWNELSQLLYEYGYVLDNGYDGKYVLHELHPTSLSATAMVDSDTAQGRVTRRIRARHEAVRVTWYPVETLTDILVFSDRTESSDDHPCNIDLADGEYYPPGSGTDDVYSVYRLEDSEILNVTNEVLPWDNTGSVTLDTETYGSKRALIKFVGGTGGGKLTRFEIRGDVTFRNMVKINKSVVYRVVNTELILEVKTRFISAKSDGDQLASDLTNYYNYAKFLYEFDVVDPAFSIAVNQEFNLNSVAQDVNTDIRVTQLSEDEWGNRHAVCEGISAYSIITAEVQDIVESSDTLNLATNLILGILPGNTFFEDFEDVDVESRWTSYGSTLGEISVITSTEAITGGKYLRVGDNSGNDERWLIANQAISYDPEKLYRIRVRVRRPNGTGQLVLGIAGRNYDKTKYVNVNGDDSFGIQHYFAASFASPGTDWTEYEGYFRGKSSTGNGGYHPEIDDPGTVHEDSKYISPIILVNHDNQTGITEVDFFSIDVVPEIDSPGLTMTINEDHSGSNPGEAIIFGFDNYRNPDKTKPGYIYIDGAKNEIPVNSDFEIVTSRIAKGYILFRYRNGSIFTLSAIERYTAYVKYENGVWYYDDNSSTWKTLSQAIIDDSVVIGTMETDTTDHIKTAQVWFYAQDVELMQQQDWDGITGTTKPEDNATLGATWNTDLNAIPDRFTDSAVTGLNVTATYMGYYDGSNFQAFIRDNGDVYFGDGGSVAGTDTFIYFDVSTEILYVSGDAKFYGSLEAATGTFQGNLSSGGIITFTTIENNAHTIQLDGTLARFRSSFTPQGWEQTGPQGTSYFTIDTTWLYWWYNFTTGWKAAGIGLNPFGTRVGLRLTGDWLPMVDATYDIGRIAPAANKWRDAYFTGTVNTGAVVTTGSTTTGTLKVGTGGATIREKQVANLTIAGNSEVLAGTFLGSTNVVYVGLSIREAGTTNRNAPKHRQVTSGLDRLVYFINTDVTQLTISGIMEQVG